MTSSAWILLSRWSRLLCFLQRLPQAEHCDAVGDLGQGRRQPREFSWDKNDSSPTARSLVAQAPPNPPPIIPTPTEELLFPLVQVATEIQNQSTQRLGEHPGAGQRLGPQPWAAKTQTCIRDGRGQAPQNTALRSGVQAALRIPRMSGTAPGTPGSPLAMYLHLLSFLLCRVGSPFLVPGSWSLVALLSPARLAAPCSSCSQKSHCSIS